MCRQLLSLNLSTDILFLDDNSPDGTGAILNDLAMRHKNVFAMHRPGKMGIGTAHQAGIDRAYELGYSTLITMDCDFTHSPADVERLVNASHGYDVTIGSRYIESNSLPGWNLGRRFLTNFGHFLTKRLLGMEHDATGALRVYNLSTIPRGIFRTVASRGYSFFFESLFRLSQNRFTVREVPIVLPARTYGHSKMTLREVFRSVRQLFALYLSLHTNPAQFRYVEPFDRVNPDLHDPQGWDAYWKSKQRTSTFVYEGIAALYRKLTLKGQLSRFIKRYFKPNAKLLHAGCGSGQVDQDIQDSYAITALDISVPALDLYARNNPTASRLVHGSVFSIPCDPCTFDGVYNLGVMEHFTHVEIQRILREFHRVLRPGGKAVIFWPHRWGSSVLVLKTVHWVLNDVFRKDVQLHPAEISLLTGARQAQMHFQNAGFRDVRYHFGPRDGYIQAVIVAEKPVDEPLTP